jgi:hypothetical protein
MDLDAANPDFDKLSWHLLGRGNVKIEAGRLLPTHLDGHVDFDAEYLPTRVVDGVELDAQLVVNSVFVELHMSFTAGPRDNPNVFVIGRAVQVEPMKPRLKSPVSKRLKLRYDKTAFKFCFQFLPSPLHIGTTTFKYPAGKGAQLDVNGTVQLAFKDVCDIKLDMRATAYVGASGDDPVFAFSARNMGTMTLNVSRCRVTLSIPC